MFPSSIYCSKLYFDFGAKYINKTTSNLSKKVTSFKFLLKQKPYIA